MSPQAHLHCLRPAGANRGRKRVPYGLSDVSHNVVLEGVGWIHPQVLGDHISLHHCEGVQAFLISNLQTVKTTHSHLETQTGCNTFFFSLELLLMCSSFCIFSARAAGVHDNAYVSKSVGDLSAALAFWVLEWRQVVFNSRFQLLPFCHRDGHLG